MMKWYTTVFGIVLGQCQFVIAQNHKPYQREQFPNFFLGSAGLEIDSYGRNSYSSWLRNNQVYSPERLYGISGEFIAGRNKLAYGLETMMTGNRTSSLTSFISEAMGFVIAYPIKTNRFAVLPMLSTGWLLNTIDFRGKVPSQISMTYPNVIQDDIHSFSWYFNPHVEFVMAFGRGLFKPGISFTVGYKGSILSSKWNFGGPAGGKLDFIPKPSLGYPYIAINYTATAWDKNN
jgi:hypothetical protein